MTLPNTTTLSSMTPIVLLAVAFAGAVTAQAQNFPQRPIRFIVPNPPGGSNDLLARMTGPRMSETWGQPVIIDNRPGAAGNIGIDLAAKAPPDGYTLVVSSMSTAISMTYYRKLPYDVLRDLQGVSLFATQPNVLIAGPNVAARTIAELTVLAKAKPGQITYATTGSGSSQHMMGELLKATVRIDLVHVPYKGTGPALNDLIGGQVALMFSPLIAAIPHMKTGRVRALAVSSPKRAPAAPDTPTMIEAGVAGYDVVSWYGVHTAAKAPRAVVEKLNQEINRILQLPEVFDRLSGLGMDPMPISVDRFNALMASEVARWAKVIKESGIGLE
jgi:tripartite-type tricarboxylate transporter receptor subunit TctC